MLIVNLFTTCFSIIFLIFIVRLFLHRTALIYAVRKWLQWLDDRVHVHQHLKVPELNGSTQQQNQFYRRVFLYLNSFVSLEDADFTNLFSGRKPNDIVLSINDNQVIRDTFLGARLSWTNEIERDNQNEVVSRSFVLRIKKKDKRRILKPYLQHIHTVFDDIELRRKELRIHYNSNGKWKSVPFNHHASFDSLVIDADLKSKIQSDLETFLKSKQYYHKLGRVWKRSYLLYGSSGTGKSSFIAAAANFLNYDIYNINLSQVIDDADLNSLLLQTSRKSLIVVEDLDRYVPEKSTSMRVTSSGLLNFMDGILNFHDERIMMFTMNSKDQPIDSSLLRPGRIDVHIYFPMCDFTSFKSLTSNYLGVKEHRFFQQVEEIFQSGATISPAEISELMLVNRSSPSRALKSVISALRSKGKNGGDVARRLSYSSESSPAPPSVAEESGGVAWKETVPKEFRKLYGLLRLKSCKTPETVDQKTRVIER